MSRAVYTTLLAGLVALVAITAVLLLHNEVFQSSTGSETRGSGVAASQTRTLPPFDGVELSGSNNVLVRFGPKQTVLVHADDNLLDRVTTTVEGGTLVVGNRPGSFASSIPMYVEITTPTLRGLALSGSGIVSARGIRSALLTVAIPGSGVIRADGRAGRLDVALGGSGEAQLEQLVSGEANVVVGGSGRVDVTATKSLDAAVSGTGAIVYGGDPARVTKEVTGTGAIIGR